jgi:hypothetical protein
MKLNRSEIAKNSWNTIKDREHTRISQELNERIERYELNPVICKNCNASIPYDKRNSIFCNRSCAATFNNTGKIKSTRQNCLCCGVETLNKKYCNNKCQQAHKWDLSKKDASNLTHSRLKRLLIETHGHKCQICNLASWMDQKIPIEMDHIDGNSSNNELSNLRLICPNCHAQTPTYKAKNKGNGRVFRRERYAAGKSY